MSSGLEIRVRPKRWADELVLVLDRSRGPTTLLGANGSGKSSVLAEVAKYCHKQQMLTIYVEGGRAVPVPGTLTLTMNNINAFSSLARVEKAYHSKTLTGITASKGSKEPTRLEAALHMLRIAQQSAVERQNEAFRAVFDDGMNFVGGKPSVVELPFDRLSRLYQKIFPHLILKFEQMERLMVYAGGESYSAEDMSDGERQVLALLVEVIANDGRRRSG